MSSARRADERAVARSGRSRLPILAARLASTLRLAIGAGLVAASAACTTLPPPVPVEGDHLSGRLAVRIDADGGAPARSFSAAFELNGSAAAGSLGLSTPLGSLLAQARWSPVEVTLTTPRESRRFASLGLLSEEALGERIPVEAWFDWLRGRPWPAAASSIAADMPAKFEQLGWSVDATSVGEGLLQAVRRQPLPPVTVRIKLDPG